MHTYVLSPGNTNRMFESRTGKGELHGYQRHIQAGRYEDKMVNLLPLPVRFGEISARTLRSLLSRKREIRN